MSVSSFRIRANPAPLHGHRETSPRWLGRMVHRAATRANPHWRKYEPSVGDTRVAAEFRMEQALAWIRAILPKWFHRAFRGVGIRCKSAKTRIPSGQLSSHVPQDTASKSVDCDTGLLPRQRERQAQNATQRGSPQRRDSKAQRRHAWIRRANHATVPQDFALRCVDRVAKSLTAVEPGVRPQTCRFDRRTYHPCFRGGPRLTCSVDFGHRAAT